MAEGPVVVCSAFLKRGERYLLVYAPYFNEDGFWRVPGGRVEGQEHAEETLAREMQEELNIKIKVKKFLGFGQDYVYVQPVQQKKARIVLYFECEALGGELKMDKHEITDHKWVTLEEIKKIKKLEPAMQDFFKQEVSKCLR
ncbi:MAG: NUDIX hydrolase [Candidatus Woesearchaeota archaeon]